MKRIAALLATTFIALTAHAGGLAKDKYTMLALIAVAKIQRKDGTGWRDLSLKDLKAQEPKKCLVEGSD